jgi:hypothetical protein
MSSYPPHYAYPSAPPVVRLLPKPPRLHWGWVLGLSVVTLGIFGAIWLVVQGYWVRKMRGGRSAGYWWAVARGALLGLTFLFGMAIAAFAMVKPVPNLNDLIRTGDLWARLVGIALYLMAAFTLRGEIEGDPINIPLGGGMTFFFAPVYFQYHLYDYGLDSGGSGKASGVTGLGLGGAAAIVDRETGV